MPKRRAHNYIGIAEVSAQARGRNWKNLKPEAKFATPAHSYIVRTQVSATTRGRNWKNLKPEALFVTPAHRYIIIAMVSATTGQVVGAGGVEEWVGWRVGGGGGRVILGCVPGLMFFQFRRRAVAGTCAITM